MTEELKTKATEALIAMIDDLTTLKEFAVEQAPSVIQELITWTVVWHGSMFLTTLMLCLIAIPISISLYKNFFDSSEGMVLIPIVTVGLCLIALLGNSFENDLKPALKAYVSPKLFLIDYARGK